MSNEKSVILPRVCTFVVGYKNSHTTIVTGRHPQGIKVFTDYFKHIPGAAALGYAHEHFVPGRIVKSTSLQRAPRNEVEESAMDILQSSDRIMSAVRVRTSDNSGQGLFIKASPVGIASGCESVLLTAAESEHLSTGLFLSTFLEACPVLKSEYISDPGWYASSLALISERCGSFM